MDIRIGAIKVGEAAGHTPVLRIPVELRDSGGPPGEITEIKGVAKVRDDFNGKEVVISHFDSCTDPVELSYMSIVGRPGILIDLPREKIWEMEKARVGNSVAIVVMCVLKRRMQGDACQYFELVHTRLNLPDRDWYRLIGQLRRET